MSSNYKGIVEVMPCEFLMLNDSGISVFHRIYTVQMAKVDFK